MILNICILMHTTVTTMPAISSNQHVQHPQRVMLITYPRTASNLLIKMLSLEDQENVLSNRMGGYFFWDAYMKGRRNGHIYKPIAHWTADDIEETRQLFQQCVDNLEDMSQAAGAQDKVLFGKEHVSWFANPAVTSGHLFDDDDGSEDQYAMPFRLDFPERYGSASAFSPENPTVLPDEYLKSWTQTFLIRHPALAFPSFYRAMNSLHDEGCADPHELIPLMKLSSTLWWTRQLYEWCCKNSANTLTGHGSERERLPIVLDAEDIIHSPSVLLRYCELVGLDPGKVRFQWNNQTKHSNVIEAVMKATLDHSSGLLPEKTPAIIDISAEADTWVDEFGEEVGGLIEKLVRDAMPDYEFLRERRLKVAHK